MTYYRIVELDTMYDGDLAIDENITVTAEYKTALRIYKDAVAYAKQENKPLKAAKSHRRLIVCLEQIEAQTEQEAQDRDLNIEKLIPLKEYTGGLKQ